MTPARAERERLRAGALQRKLNEEKFTEFRLACGEGDGTACNSLGEWWATMRGDYARSMAIFADNCAANGHANSCFNAGLQMSIGRGTKKDVPRAMLLFDKACSAGNADACAAAGRERIVATSTPRDVDKGLQQLRLACAEEGQGSACSFLGSVLLSGKYGVPRDPAAAAGHLARACEEQADTAACHNLSMQYMHGDGVEVDRVAARKYATRMRELLQSQLGRKLPTPAPRPSPGAEGPGR